MSTTPCPFPQPFHDGSAYPFGTGCTPVYASALSDLLRPGYGFEHPLDAPDFLPSGACRAVHLYGPSTYASMTVRRV
jgi:hypothetical protein